MGRFESEPMESYIAQPDLGGYWSVLLILRDSGEACFDHVIPNTRHEQFAKDLAQALNDAARQRRMTAQTEGQS